MFIVGLIGLPGSGKGAVATRLQESCEKQKHTVRILKFSEIIGETCDLWGLEKSRGNMQTIGTIMAGAFGGDVLAKAIAQRMSTAGAYLYILDGIRREAEADFVKAQPGGILIGVVTQQQLRYERVLKRAEKAGDATKTWKQFLAEDRAPAEQEVESLLKRANIILDNNGSYEELLSKVDNIYHHPV